MISWMCRFISDLKLIQVLIFYFFKCTFDFLPVFLSEQPLYTQSYASHLIEYISWYYLVLFSSIISTHICYVWNWILSLDIKFINCFLWMFMTEIKTLWWAFHFSYIFSAVVFWYWTFLYSLDVILFIYLFQICIYWCS